jgi:ParB-like chromosome segregation protein Spo0J
LTTGWIQPVLANRDKVIIDGFHRWRLSQDSKAVKARWGGRVPVAILDIDRAEAIAVTVRINRAKGSHVAVDMAKLVKELFNDHFWDVDRVAKEIGATKDEVNLLLQDGVFAAKNIDKWQYSKAWYPIKVKG